MATAAAACKTTRHSSDSHPHCYPTVEAVKAIGWLLEERTNGRLRVEVFHPAQLGEEKGMIDCFTPHLDDFL